MAAVLAVVALLMATTTTWLWLAAFIEAYTVAVDGSLLVALTDVSPNAAAVAVVVAERLERRVGEGLVAEQGPVGGVGHALLAEDPQHVGIGDGAADLVAAAVVPLADRQPGARVVGRDLALEPGEQVDRAVQDVVGDPAVLDVGRVPQRAGGLLAGGDLGRAVTGGVVGDADAAAGGLRVPVDVEVVDQALARRGRRPPSSGSRYQSTKLPSAAASLAFWRLVKPSQP